MFLGIYDYCFWLVLENTQFAVLFAVGTGSSYFCTLRIKIICVVVFRGLWNKNHSTGGV